MTVRQCAQVAPSTGERCTHQVDDTTSACTAGHPNGRFTAAALAASPVDRYSSIAGTTVLSVADLVGAVPQRPAPSERPRSLVELPAVDLALDEAGDDPTRLARLVQSLDAAILDLKLVRDEVEQRLVGCLPARRAELSGVGMLEVKTDTSRAWDDQGVSDALVAKVVGTAGSTDPAVTRAVRLTVATLHRCARLEWRSTALKELGIDPEEHSERTFGRKRVLFPSRKAGL